MSDWREHAVSDEVFLDYVGNAPDVDRTMTEQEWGIWLRFFFGPGYGPVLEGGAMSDVTERDRLADQKTGMQCEHCLGRGWNPGDCHPRQECGACAGTGPRAKIHTRGPAAGIGMTRLERLRRELVALANSLEQEASALHANAMVMHDGDGTTLMPHHLAQPLRGIAWSLMPREERYREPEHGGGPLASGSVDVEKASAELASLIEHLPERRREPDADRYNLVWRNLRRIRDELLSAVIKAHPGETLENVLRREGLEIAEETCGACGGDGLLPDVAKTWVACSECRGGLVVAEDAIEVRCGGQVTYARSRA